LRGGIAIAFLILAGCGTGTGEGLDQNGLPLVGGGSPATTLEPTLDSIQANVFSVSSAIPGCHGDGTVQFGLRLDPGFSAGNLIDVASPQDPTLIRVIPGNSNSSFLIQKLEGTQTVGMRMPAFSPPLPQSTIDVIRQWIQDGAPQ